MGIKVQESNGNQLVARDKVTSQNKKTEKESSNIFEGVSNNDLSLLGDVVGTLSLGVAALRTLDVTNGLIDLKDVVMNKSPLTKFKLHNISQMKIKSAKWQIPLFLVTSAAAFLFSKYCKEA